MKSRVFFVVFTPLILVMIGYVYHLSLFSYAYYSLTIYGIISLIHFLLQIHFARKEAAFMIANSDHGYRPSVSVIVPVHNENAEMFRQCLLTLKSNNPSEVIVTDDGSDEYIKAIYNEVAEKNWYYIRGEQAGKRPAMHRALDIARGEIIVCIDSDTIFLPDTIYYLVQPFVDPRVGATTANVRLYQPKSLIGKISNYRYWLAFNLERSAQAYFGAMSCVSGPCGAYRRDLLMKIRDAWVNQTFLGLQCSFGDDRHLTNLVLTEGYRTSYVPTALAYTLFPPTLRQWLKQQLRWNRSFYREYLVNFKSFDKTSSWLPYDLTYQAIFPFFMMYNIGAATYTAYTVGDYWLFLITIGSIFFYSSLRALYGMTQTDQPDFFIFILYSLYYIIFLMPLKVYGLLTMWQTTWGTAPRKLMELDHVSLGSAEG